MSLLLLLIPFLKPYYALGFVNRIHIFLKKKKKKKNGIFWKKRKPTIYQIQLYCHCSWAVFEPPHDKPTQWHVRPAKTDHPGQSLCSAHLEKPRTQGSWTVLGLHRLIILGGCPGWSESSLGAHSFCWFCHVAAQMQHCSRPQAERYAVL